MAYNYEYPYTDFNRVNDDWLINRVKELTLQWLDVQGEWTSTKTEWSDVQTAWEDLKNYIDTYFNNLNVTDEVNARVSVIMNEYLTSGTLTTLIRPFIAGPVSSWLDSHITEPVGVVIDTSLSISGAVADAAVTGEIREDLTKNYTANRIVSGQLFSKNDITPDCYVSYTTGNLSGYNTSFAVSDYIPITPGKRYNLSNTLNQQLAFYDMNKNYVSGLSGANALNSADIPSNCYFIRFTIPTANINIVRFICSTDILNTFGDYIERVTLDSFLKENVADSISDANIAKTNMIKKTIYNVTPSYFCGYANLNTLISYCKNGDRNHQYDIFLDVGTYTLNADTTPPDYVNIIGADRDKVIIKYTQANNAPATDIERYSTLNTMYNNTFSNLTIRCKNARYPVHDDGGVPDTTREWRNCIFEHLGNQDARDAQNNQTIWTSECAYGAGTRSGNSIKFKDCIFKSNYIPFSVHNNVNFDKSSRVDFENCMFLLGSNPLINYAIRIQSDGSLLKDYAIFKGCSANAPMLIHDNWLGSPSIVNRTEWSIGGYGNNISYASEYTTGEMYVPRFNDEVRTVKTNSTLVKGQLCVFDTSLSNVRLMTDADDISLFAGIATEDVAIGNIVALKHSGYVYKKWLTTLNSVMGLYYGCGADGKLIVTADKTKAILIGLGDLQFKFIR